MTPRDANDEWERRIVEYGDKVVDKDLKGKT